MYVNCNELDKKRYCTLTATAKLYRVPLSDVQLLWILFYSETRHSLM